MGCCLLAGWRLVKVTFMGFSSVWGGGDDVAAMGFSFLWVGDGRGGSHVHIVGEGGWHIFITVGVPMY